jgi:hypothetical protein
MSVARKAVNRRVRDSRGQLQARKLAAAAFRDPLSEPHKSRL